MQKRQPYSNIYKSLVIYQTLQFKAEAESRTFNIGSRNAK